MHALVVYESMFGNTRAIAEAIAKGMSTRAKVRVTDVVDAPAEVPPEVDVLVVGGPTHAFSMSREATRQDAARRGGAHTDVPAGIREWLRELPDGDHPQTFVAFDTRVDLPLVPGAAARSASRQARKRGFTVADPESFLVEGYEGPLADGELDRATAWGRRLGEQLEQDLRTKAAFRAAGDAR
ncbi:flavodoxin domain-containing protein [Microbacterium sp. X-17]|uniref:flavodoxin family protein n=1 Tax=Microbacterium sp. X-17 TaxID=3144404 RepID=UPI0031F54641